MSLNKFTDDNIKEYLNVGCNEVNCNQITAGDIYVPVAVGNNKVLMTSNNSDGKITYQTLTSNSIYASKLNNANQVLDLTSGPVNVLFSSANNTSLGITNTNTSSLVILTAGVYKMDMSLSVSSSTNQTLHFLIYKNGSQMYAAENYCTPGTAGTESASISYVTSLAVNDAITVEVSAFSGTAGNATVEAVSLNVMKIA